MALDLLILMILTMQYTWSFWFSWCGRSKVVPFSYRTEPEKSSCPWIWCRPARRNPQKSEPRQSVYNDLMKNMPGMPACFLPVLATDTMRVLSFVGRYLPILVSLAGRVWTEWLLGLVAPIPNELLWLPMALNIVFWTIVTIIVDSLGFLGVAVQSQYFLHTELNWRNHCVLEFGAGQLEETDKEANQGNQSITTWWKICRACRLPVLATDTMRVLSFVGRYLPILVSLAGRVWTEWLLGLVAPIPNELLWLPMALNIVFWTIVTIIVDSLGFLGVAVQSQYFLHTELNWRNHCVLEFGAGQLEETHKEGYQGRVWSEWLLRLLSPMRDMRAATLPTLWIMRTCSF